MPEQFLDQQADEVLVGHTRVNKSERKGREYRESLPQAHEPVIASLALELLGALRAPGDHCNLFTPDVLL